MALHTIALVRLSGLCLLLLISSISGFNIDTKIPVIKKGVANSYFGFSIAQHQIVNSDDSVRDDLLLVGAPKYDDVLQTYRDSGGIFSCNAKSYNSTDCMLRQDAERNFRTDENEIRSDQWLGQTVRSAGRGGIAVYCAPRYQINYNPVGRCGSFQQDLTPYRELPQCQDDGNQNAGEAYCQSGFSAKVTPDNEMLFGAPGAVDWTGMISKIRLEGTDRAWYSSQAFESDTEKRAVDKNSYMGFSVTVGRFRGYSSRVYIGGAPKSNYTGQVVAFHVSENSLRFFANAIISGEYPFSGFGSDVAAVDLDSDGYDELIVGSPFFIMTDKEKNQYAGGAIYVYSSGVQLSKNTPYIRITNSMSESECKAVDCLEGRFGYSVAGAGDINLDGYQDLVVGAPYENFGKGAVYVYMGSMEGISKKYAQRIQAADVQSDLVTFGFALSGGLDLDTNGYPDVSVGAYGSDSVIMLRTRPIVHLSSNITVFPTKFNLSNTQGCQFISNTNALKPKYCVQLRVCLTYTAKPVASFSTPQDILVKVVAEEGSQNKRVYLNDSTNQNTDEVSYVQVLQNQGKEDCHFMLLFLKDGIRDKLTPISVSVTYGLKSEEPSMNRRKKRQANEFVNINKYPILLTGESTTSLVMTKIDFVKKCGNDDICQSDIGLDMSLNLRRNELGNYVYGIGEVNELVVDVTLKNTGEPAYEPTLYLIVPPEMIYTRSVAVIPEGITPPDCSENITVLRCPHSNPFGDKEKSDIVTRFKIILDPSKLNASMSSFTIKGMFNTTSLEANTNDDMQTLEIDVVTRANIKVFGFGSPSGDIVFRGEVRGESSITAESEVGPPVNHTFTVLNEGPGTLESAILIINWPYELSPGIYEKGKNLLYLMESKVLTPTKAELATPDPSIYDYLNLVDDPSTMFLEVPTARRKREAEDAQPTAVTYNPEDNTDSPVVIRSQETKNKRNVVELKCADKTARCRMISVRIKQLQQNEQARIVVRGRLWESTLIQDYQNVEEVRIYSSATIYIPENLNIKQSETDDDTGYAITYAVPAVESSVKKDIEWWIVLVAVICAIVILILIILLLWKCGFFKRLKPADYEPTHTGELKKTKDYDNL